MQTHVDPACSMITHHVLWEKLWTWLTRDWKWGFEWSGGSPRRANSVRLFHGGWEEGWRLMRMRMRMMEGKKSKTVCCFCCLPGSPLYPQGWPPLENLGELKISNFINSAFVKLWLKSYDFVAAYTEKLSFKTLYDKWSWKLWERMCDTQFGPGDVATMEIPFMVPYPSFWWSWTKRVSTSSYFLIEHKRLTPNQRMLKAQKR